MSAAAIAAPRRGFRGRRVEDLEAELERLGEYVAELERIAFATDWTPPPEWGLTPCQERIFGLLLARGRATHAQIATALYGLRPVGEIRGRETIDMHLSKLRKRLRPFAVEILTIWGVGLGLDAETRERLRKPGGRA